MKFKYRKLPNPLDPTKPWVLRPYIPVRLLYRGNHKNTFGLVDSGADITLFHASLGRALGVAIEQGRVLELFGATGTSMKVYLHQIELQIIGAQETMTLEAGFSDALPVTGLLGQVGFFEHYRITFERAKERIEIVPAKP